VGRGGRAGLAAQSAGIAPAGVPAGLYPVRTSGRMGLFAKGTHWCEGGQMPSGREWVLPRLSAGGILDTRGKTRQSAEVANRVACSGVPRPRN
jgi:hypothetical protein